MPLKEYQEELQETKESGYRRAFEDATAFLESGKTTVEWVEMLSRESGKTTEQWVESAKNYEINFYIAFEAFLKDHEKENAHALPRS